MNYHSLIKTKETLETGPPKYLHNVLVETEPTKSAMLKRKYFGGPLRRDNVKFELIWKTWNG